MPSSLYRLAGKSHHAEAKPQQSPPAEIAEVQASVPDVVIPAAVEATVVSHVAVNDEQVVEETVTVDAAAEANDTEALVSDGAENTTATQFPTWDPNWSKAQLLVVANELGLSVTSINTKTEIIRALTAATSA